MGNAMEDFRNGAMGSTPGLLVGYSMVAVALRLVVTIERGCRLETDLYLLGRGPWHEAAISTSQLRRSFSAPSPSTSMADHHSHAHDRVPA